MSSSSGRAVWQVLSPMGGTYYRSPAPGEPPFIREGDKVKKGQTICIIEAMKLMNEIEVRLIICAVRCDDVCTTGSTPSSTLSTPYEHSKHEFQNFCLLAAWLREFPPARCS